jgi:hypothetical protein
MDRFFGTLSNCSKDWNGEKLTQLVENLGQVE